MEGCIEMRRRHHDHCVRLRNDDKGIMFLMNHKVQHVRMTTRATLKMIGTELARRQVTHVNTLPRGDLSQFLRLLFGLALVSLQKIQICVLSTHCDNVSVTFPASVLPHAATILSARSSHDAAHADTTRSDLVCHVNALADASNGGESLRWSVRWATRMKFALFGRLFPLEIHICKCNEVRCACRVEQNGIALLCEIDTCEIDVLPHETKHHPLCGHASQSSQLVSVHASRSPQLVSVHTSRSPLLVSQLFQTQGNLKLARQH